MNDREEYGARLGTRALPEVLAELGCAPLGSNPNIRVAEPDIGDLLTLEVDKPGVAPVRVIFGTELNIWVGPYSEVVVLPLRDETFREAKALISKVLRSEIRSRYRRRSVELTLGIPGNDPWARLVVRGADGAPLLDAKYTPFVE
jgi:hypothetical protein